MPTWLDKILNSQSVQLALAALAFLIALWLVIVIARMLMGGRLRLPGGRSRQPRLGIVDAFDLDRQRQLIIVRRDNTEHLIMIGGPNDLLIESEIVRVEAREFRDGRRDKALEPVVDTRLPGDGRIPAPVGTANNGDHGAANGARAEEPLLPMALPPAPAPAGIAAAVPPAEAPPVQTAGTGALAPRVPTFPLPPRRPAGNPLPPERRAPAPERARGPEPAPGSPVPAETAPPPPAGSLAAASTGGPIPPPSPAATEPLPPTAPGSPVGAPAGGEMPARPPRPTPYLKPLPPRPPIRPLKRVTPQAEPGGATLPPSARPAEPTLAAPLPGTASPGAPEVPAHDPSAAPPTSEAAPPPASSEKDALESLEEEMAKLLGRGG